MRLRALAVHTALLLISADHVRLAAVLQGPVHADPPAGLLSWLHIAGWPVRTTAAYAACMLSASCFKESMREASPVSPVSCPIGKQAQSWPHVASQPKLFLQFSHASWCVGP